jgi:hypothetical protein
MGGLKQPPSEAAHCGTSVKFGLDGSQRTVFKSDDTLECTSVPTVRLRVADLFG